jgi:multicomponent Na+:H+ antiporter subunit D
MNNWVVLPLLIPLLTGVCLVFLQRRLALQEWLAMISMALTLWISIWLVWQVSENGIQVLHIGGWEAPFGITLVVDMLSALLLATSSIVSLACLLYAIRSIDVSRKTYYLYPFILFLVSGVNGSFMTGDIFNLFVFFEVMLLASYVLLGLGGEKRQLRESIKYVIINVISSTLFVVAVAYLYSVTGTLNLAHLSERVAAAGQEGLITTVSLLFLTVFGMKAALFLFFWLPGSYSAPPGAIAAMFAALLTKVGIYSILRMFTLIFYHQPQITHTIMLWMAALTMLLGAAGAVSQWRIRPILAYNVVISVGFIIFGVALATPESLSGSLFYLIHDMLAKALIFILGGAMISIFGTDNLKEISGFILFRPVLGWLFFISALALAGVPPLSGFVGKVMILQGGIDQGYLIMSGVGILTSLLVMYSLIKVFIHSFWGESLLGQGEEKATGSGALLPGTILVALMFGMGLGAEWVIGYIDQAVEVMANPALYIDAVLRK